MSQRHEFVRRVRQRRETMAELCAEFSISEKTGYKWMARFRADGAAGLADRSHAPHRAARSTTRNWGLTAATAPNDVWAADFKGQFRLGMGAYCYPLTVTDSYSRFLLGCTALRSTDTILTRSVFERLFQEHGLPQVLRTDNGVPFAAPVALGQLSSLAVWWIRLGIRPERIDRGKPQQNGRHERMHRTLRAETAKPAARPFSFCIVFS